MNFFDTTTVNKIRSLSAKAEETKQIPKEWLKLIYSEKLFKLFVPEKDGGLMLPLPEALRLFDEAAFIDGNFAWAITIGSGGGYFYAFMKPEIARKVFKDARAVIAGGGKPADKVQKIKEGYRVSGKWQYASGASYATTFTASIKTEKNKIIAVILEPKQVRINQDWNAMGMKATESHSVSANSAIISTGMTFDLASSKLFYEHPFYHYPFLQFAETSFAALTLGLGRHFFAEAHTMLKENKKNWSVIEGRYAFVKTLLDKKEMELNKVSDQFYKTIDASWKGIVKNNTLSDKTKKAVSAISKKSSRVVLNNVDAVIQYLGMSAVMEDSVINKIWRDTHTVCHHVLLVPYEAV
jgi:indole-3-acetate monooxygenase